MLKAIKNTYRYFNAVGLRGLCCAAWGITKRSEVRLTLRRDEIRFPFSVRIPSSDVPTYTQVFLKQDYDFMTEEDPVVIVDAGANIGLSAIYFANRYPIAKIIAIEPERKNFEILKINAAPYDAIIPVHAALWNEEGEICLIDPGLGSWGFMTEAQDHSTHPSGVGLETVKTITVDRIMETFALDRIDIFKIDIEGAEKEVFQDNPQWIDKVDALIIELHDRRKPGCSRSVYNVTQEFDNEWMQGENVYLSRGNRISRRTL